MKNISLLFTILSTILVTISFRLWAANLKSETVNYHAAGEIPINGQGGWDALSIDPEAHRLFVSHADRVIVIDTIKNQIIKEIPDTPGVHCIAIAADLQKAFSTNGKEGKVSVIDLNTLTTKTKIKVGEKPDAIAYDPNSHEVYAFNGNAGTVSIIDGKNDRVITTVALPGKPEFAIADPRGHRIFVNIEDKNTLVVLDTKTHKVTNTWNLEGCESPSGIALDAKNHHIFSVCENEKMVMIDTVSGKTIASVPTGKGTDGADFDPETGLAFSSNGKTGTVTVIKEDHDRLTVVQTVKTSVGARTIVLNPKDHRIYLPTAKFQATEKGSRPKPIDGTQTVLIFAP